MMTAAVAAVTVAAVTVFVDIFVVIVAGDFDGVFHDGTGPFVAPKGATAKGTATYMRGSVVAAI